MSDFFNASNIEKNENAYHVELLSAVETAQNAYTISAQARRSIRRNRVDAYSAAIPSCHLQWATTVSHVVERQFNTDGLRHDPDLFFVTLIDRDWIAPADQAVDLGFMKRKLRMMIGHRSSLFVIEPSYYANIADSLYESKTCLSWHVHGLMWHLGASDVRKFVDSINSSSKFRTLVPTRVPAHARAIKQGHLPRHVGYILKPPANAYRVLSHRKQHSKDERRLGIPVEPIHSQRKQLLRPGERVRLFNAMYDIDPCDLLVGSGDGREIISQVRSQLRRQIGQRRSPFA